MPEEEKLEKEPLEESPPEEKQAEKESLEGSTSDSSQPDSDSSSSSSSSAAKSRLRAGPGAVRRMEWRPLAACWLQDRKVVLGADSAKNYRARVLGVLHHRVVHKKKMCVKAGAQVIDRCWRFLKERLSLSQHTKSGSTMLRAKLRSAQYQYWFKNIDMWMATGSLSQ